MTPLVSATDLTGRLVTFAVNTLHGKGKMAGIVRDLREDGRYEVRGQNGGIYKLHRYEFVLVVR